MSWAIKIIPPAQSDITEIIGWYDEQKDNLGIAFFDALADSLNLLKVYPRLFQIRHKSIRQAPVKRFPFFIFYKIDEKLGLIIILAVLHGSRDPRVWKGRA